MSGMNTNCFVMPGQPGQESLSSFCTSPTDSQRHLISNMPMRSMQQNMLSHCSCEEQALHSLATTFSESQKELKVRESAGRLSHTSPRWGHVKLPELPLVLRLHCSSSVVRNVVRFRKHTSRSLQRRRGSCSPRHDRWDWNSDHDLPTLTRSRPPQGM